MNHVDQHNNDGLHRRLEDLDEVIDQVDELLTTDGNRQPGNRLLSVIIPVKDERDTIQPLCHRIATCVPQGYEYEIILVDDGSRDGSWSIIQRLAQTYSTRIRGIKFRHNAGKAMALAAGFRAARGELVFTMDADLQDEPQEIPRFLAKIDEGYDLVSGWKRTRHDPWHKVLPSRVFNVLASALGGVWLHDHNCGFKCYRAATIERLSLHGELHRMIPAMAGMHGFRSTEIVVRHHPRRAGRSKYGVERYLHGFCDLLTIGYLRRFQQRPSHFFNAVAGIQMCIAIAMGAVGFWSSATSTTGLFCLMICGLFVAMANTAVLGGLLAELVIRGPLNMHNEMPVAHDTGLARRQAPRPFEKPNGGNQPLPHVAAVGQ